MKSLNILAALTASALLIGCNNVTPADNAPGDAPDVNVNVPAADAPDLNVTVPPAEPAPDVNINVPPAEPPPQ